MRATIAHRYWAKGGWGVGRQRAGERAGAPLRPRPARGLGRPALLARARGRRSRAAARPTSPARMPALRVTIGASREEGRAWFDRAGRARDCRCLSFLPLQPLCVSVTVHDGDTIRCGRERVRIANIDAPELPGSPKCQDRRRSYAWCDYRAGEASRVALVRLALARSGHDHAAWHRSLWADACHNLGERRGRRRLPDRARPREALALTRPFARGGTLKFPDQPALRAGADAQGRCGKRREIEVSRAISF
jgi:hypothetical protein